MIDDYRLYRLNFRERTIYILQGLAAISIIGFLFYSSLLSVLPLSPLLIIYIKRKKQQLIKKRKWQLNLEFRDGILSLSSALNAGYSIEKAFDEALAELKHLYGNRGLIVKEFTYLANQIKLNITVEKALIDFGQRTDIEDIINFAQVFITAKRTGGDLMKIIKATCETISDKIEVKREILTLTSAKRLEANIMKIVPIGILVYMRLFSPGYLDILYHNVIGVIIMTILLLLYLTALIITDKIVDIEI